MTKYSQLDNVEPIELVLDIVLYSVFLIQKC